MENKNWVLDPAHSVLQFNITHLMIATLRGTFNEIEGTVEAEDNFENAKFSFSANVDSVDTNDEKRDAHLKGPDFFETDKFPKLSFTSTKFTKITDDKFELTGNLTIKNTTKSVVLNADFGGTMIDPWGNLKAGFELKGKINRKDYGLTWNAQIEAGGTMVSEEVTLIANIELLKK
ncbi:YceI family protein [Flavobacterium sp. K5-23]|uniref:YceI family protein n=1 Tax=Flavobacterium sp. K5-23 TaxID=2746225 RepID=UPI00200E639D|nr:YceI family protein [Flavobacterium sp. K5-23]UQD57511.1 YceI family protein [Flavobacterium sp. K5-23]